MLVLTDHMTGTAAAMPFGTRRRIIFSLGGRPLLPLVGRSIVSMGTRHSEATAQYGRREAETRWLGACLQPVMMQLPAASR